MHLSLLLHIVFRIETQEMVQHTLLHYILVRQFKFLHVGALGITLEICRGLVIVQHISSRLTHRLPSAKRPHEWHQVSGRDLAHYKQDTTTQSLLLMQFTFGLSVPNRGNLCPEMKVQ